MKWNIISRTIEMKSNERRIIKSILITYPNRNMVNKLINKFNKERIVLDNNELSTLYTILVSVIDDCNESERDFIEGFICNIA